jgi:hypothetical protein
MRRLVPKELPPLERMMLTRLFADDARYSMVGKRRKIAGHRLYMKEKDVLTHSYLRRRL